jgi:urease accessory protein
MTTLNTSLPRAHTHRPAGQWPNDTAVGSLTLDFDQRHRRRIRLTDDLGQDLLLDLPDAVAMADGDGLHLDDGRWLRIRAAIELVVEIRHTDPSQLLRLAWHLGNRHVPTEIRDQVLCIRPDHVIEEMLFGLGAKLIKVQVAFQPQSGAYGRHHHHHHVHDAEGHLNHD